MERDREPFLGEARQRLGEQRPGAQQITAVAAAEVLRLHPALIQKVQEKLLKLRVLVGRTDLGEQGRHHLRSAGIEFQEPVMPAFQAARHAALELA